MSSRAESTFMPLPIEDYAVIGDCHTAALVGKDGSVDWLCLPRFDSGACFAALLGDHNHGRWKIATAPSVTVREVTRRYRDGTLILETEFRTDDGSAVRVTDLMPVRDTEDNRPDVVRRVTGLSGRVPMRMELVIRFDYGSIVPWVRKFDGGIRAVGGPDSLILHADIPTHGENLATVAEFDAVAGETVDFVAAWQPSHRPPLEPVDAGRAEATTEKWWRDWSGRCTYRGPYREQVLRSLITLKAMTYAPTGGIVAAVTTSLPEQLAGVRNWDYRFCWLRDATFTLYALAGGGFLDEARAWRRWLVRAVAGTPSHAQIMYGLGGERRLTELELGWLPGYEGAKPVRIGNAASNQFQLDVYGEVLDALYQCRVMGLESDEEGWRVVRHMLGNLEDIWREPDEGIWEVRGPRLHFTHSKVMAWVAFDRAVKACDRFGRDGPRDRWAAARDAVRDAVLREGFDRELGSFTQSFGSRELDASLLMIPLVGFLPATDPRVVGTMEAIRRHLTKDGLVARYDTSSAVDGLPAGEGTFLPCSFWMADNLALTGRLDEARDLFHRLLGLCNDVGLISEEYDVHAGRLVGNFPQAFTHVGLVNTALNLTRASSPARDRPSA
jgi:GH15 family glucan-1,4-alpha-glucosidase